MSLKVVKLRHRSIALLFIILVIRRRKSRKGETVRWRDSILLCHSATLFAVAWNYYVCVLGETNNLKKRKRAEAWLHDKGSATELASVNAALARTLAQIRVKRYQRA